MMRMRQVPPDRDVIRAAGVFGKRDALYPPQERLTYDALLSLCGVYPTLGGARAVAHIEKEIREAYEQYGAKLYSHGRF